MSNIRVDLNTPIQDGTEVVFRSPVDCSQVTGLVVYYDGGSQEFAFADAHGNNVGDIDHLFAENVAVKVILDVTTSMAFVQNADTNAYLEGRFKELDDKIANSLLIVTVDLDDELNLVNPSHSAVEVYEHINNGGCAVMYVPGPLKIYNFSGYDADIETATFSFVDGDGIISAIQLTNNNVIPMFALYSRHRLEAVEMELTRIENVENNIDDIETDIGNIEAALDAIIDIQNTLIGGDEA